MIVKETARFRDWLKGLKDVIGRRRIVARIARIVSSGHLGDVEPVGDGVSELRVHVGPGYRVYFTRRGDELIVLLCGGDKDSQERDIRLAKAMAAEQK